MVVQIALVAGVAVAAGAVVTVVIAITSSMSIRTAGRLEIQNSPRESFGQNLEFSEGVLWTKFRLRTIS